MPKKQASGLYRTKIKIGTDQNGKPIVKYISGKTKAELERHRQQVISQYIDKSATPDTLIGEYAVRWMEQIIKPNVKAATYRQYRTLMNTHILPYFGSHMFRAVTASDVQIWLNSKEHLSRNTVQLMRTLLRQLFNQAVNDEIINRSPVEHVIIPRNAKEPETRRDLTPQERATLLQAASNHKYGIMVALLYYTGMRFGEMAALSLDDIDFANQQIHINHTLNIHNQIAAPKTKNSVRTIPMPLPLYDLLKMHIQSLPQNAHYLFTDKNGKLLCLTSHTSRWSVVRKDCKLTDISPHYLRHNYATLCYENGIDPYTASKLLGHSNIQTTMNLYTHLSQSHLLDVGEKVNKMFS